jgi:glutamate-ammonia-ligase adenylyltransferase
MSAESLIPPDLPAVLHSSAGQWLERYQEAHPGAPPGVGHVKLAAVSEFAGLTMLRYGVHSLDLPDAATVRAFVDRVGESDEGIDAVKREMREFRNRFLAALIYREIEQPERFVDTLARWSHFADSMLDAASRYAVREVERRFGRIRNAAGRPVHAVILGLGKLGGYELNFSSDVDLVFLYTEGGASDGRKQVTAETWFTRYSQQLITLIDEVTANGFVFRADTRLRPFGASGPPVASFAALESYLVSHGRTWERYAYIKARAVGPAVPDTVHENLFDALIHPFVYRRYLDYGIFESLREMHAMIANEVARHELRDNLKRGPGGIREIEFIVQSIQLLRGGSSPELARPELLAVLPLLADDRTLTEADCESLRRAYVILRRAENFIQGMRDRQVHELPTDPLDRARLACAMGFDSWDTLAAEIDGARASVREQFDAVAFGQGDGQAATHPATSLWRGDADLPAWQAVFGSEETDVAAVAKRIAAFRDDPQTRKADAIAARRLDELMPGMLEHIASTPAPLATLDRVLAIVSGVLRRSAYLALLLENPAAAKRLVDLCAASRYLAVELARYPVLLDELLDTRVHGEGLTRDELAAALNERLARVDTDDTELVVEALAQFQRATLFRIAVADFNGRLPLMKVSDALTFLAEVVLDAALDIAWQEMTARYGQPAYHLDGADCRAGFGIVAYGKLGGLELSYGSDLDIVFINDSAGTRQQTDGERPLDNSVFFMRLTRRLIHFLTTQTRSGVLYEIDTRLRPSGRKGLLVTTLDAFARYQEEDAWTWEHQALLRARAVAGSPGIAARFDEIRRRTLTAAVNLQTLREDVSGMRRKMRLELDRSDPDWFDLKHGAGGLGDIEFLVQYLVLRNAPEHPVLIEYSDNIRQLDALRDTGLLGAEDAERLQDIYRRYRQRQHRLALDERNPLVPAAEFAAEAATVTSLWGQSFGLEAR